MKMTVILLACLVVGIALFAGNIMSRVEQPKYQVVQSFGPFEIRDYDPLILAEVDVSGERKEAIQNGFRMLADYIFGNNASKENPKEPEKIAMTAPVMQEKQGSEWKIRFVMPAEYQLQNLPTPKSGKVRLIPIPSERFAAIRFSGSPSDETIRKKTEELQQFIHEKQLTPIGNPILSFYNPPWTLPFLRRNEVMIQILR